MATSNGYSFIDHMKSKALRFWARFSDDEASEVNYTRDELEAQQGLSVDGEVLHRRWEMDAKREEMAGPTERPDFESPGTYPPSHRKLAEERASDRSNL